MGSPVCPGCGGLNTHLGSCLNAAQRILMRVVELTIDAAWVDWIADTQKLTETQIHQLRDLSASKREDAERWDRS